MAKPTVIKIRLNSSADTGYFYVTKKNPRTKTEKLKFKKYDYRTVWGDGGHTGKHGGSILPDSMRWLWRDTPPAPAGKSAEKNPGRPTSSRAPMHASAPVTVRNTEVAFLTGIKGIIGSDGFTLTNSKVDDVGRGVQGDWAGSDDFYIADNVFVGRHDKTALMGWTEDWRRGWAVSGQTGLR